MTKRRSLHYQSFKRKVNLHIISILTKMIYLEHCLESVMQSFLYTLTIAHSSRNNVVSKQLVPCGIEGCTEDIKDTHIYIINTSK